MIMITHILRVAPLHLWWKSQSKSTPVRPSSYITEVRCDISNGINTTLGALRFRNYSVVSVAGDKWLDMDLLFCYKIVIA
jgi:hypothetical protein